MRWIFAPILFVAALLCPAAAAESRPHPNIVFVLADDLGYGDLGCYGQKIIRTPNLDRLAGEGVRLTRHYAGNNVCAPSRCVLMTGMHPGHAFVRDNADATPPKGGKRDLTTAGQIAIPADAITVATVLKNGGYTCAMMGKWGLGPNGSSGDWQKHGFDRFVGYVDQRHAHNFYPDSYWDDRELKPLDGAVKSPYAKLPPGSDLNNPALYAGFTGKTYVPDLALAAAVDFVRTHKDKPFFLYYPTTVPHLALQVPEDSLAEYAGKFPDPPYDGTRAYLPHRQPRAAYAAMITRMDRDIGRIMEEVKTQGLDDDTIFIFSSDNGPLYDQLGGTDTEFFDSAGGLRGRKGSFDEGGIRVPGIVRWPGKVPAGVVSDRLSGFEDWLPTLTELAGLPAVSHKIDGVSMAPALLGRTQAPRPFLYRESPGYDGEQTILISGDWKAMRRGLRGSGKQGLPPRSLELYNLKDDPGQTKDVAAEHPEIISRMEEICTREHAFSPVFPLPAVDPVKPGKE